MNDPVSRPTRAASPVASHLQGTLLSVGQTQLTTPEVLNTIAGVIRDRVGVEDGFEVMVVERFDAAAHIIEALRSLPVELRMEAMGMEPAVDDGVRYTFFGETTWVEPGALERACADD